jgi:hypothetical protein
MSDDERVWDVKTLLFDYVKSPSLRHIRDPYSISRLAQDIVKRIDRGNSIWKKWNGPRDLLKSAIGCWIPVDGLRDFLNAMPGPALRMRRFGNGCLAIYERETAEGSELPAIVGLLREHVENEEQRLSLERQQRYQRHREEERLAREQRLLSGIDCNWTQLHGSQHWYCRKNGRTYRLSPTNDKRWTLDRVCWFPATRKAVSSVNTKTAAMPPR